MTFELGTTLISQVSAPKNSFDLLTVSDAYIINLICLQ